MVFGLAKLFFFFGERQLLHPERRLVEALNAIYIQQRKDGGAVDGREVCLAEVAVVFVGLDGKTTTKASVLGKAKGSSRVSDFAFFENLVQGTQKQQLRAYREEDLFLQTPCKTQDARTAQNRGRPAAALASGRFFKGTGNSFAQEAAKLSLTSR